MNIHNLAQKKAEIRKRLKLDRSAIPAEARRIYTETITRRLLELDAVVTANTIFIYISCGSEVGTRELMIHFLEDGRTLVVPKIINSDHMIATPFTSWDELIPGQLGILTPKGNEPYDGEIDVAITPGVGFSPEGYRIGYGRGYYDKWFAGHGETAKIGIAYETQVIDEIPVAENDVPVDVIVTEKRVIRFQHSKRRGRV